MELAMAGPARDPDEHAAHNLALHGLLRGFWTTGGRDEGLGARVVSAALDDPCCATAVLRARQVARRIGQPDALADVQPSAAGDRDRYGVHALVLTPFGRDGLCVGAVVKAGAGGGVTPLDLADPQMCAVAETVLGRFRAGRAGLAWRLEWPLQNLGAAIGLPLHVAGLVALHGLPADPRLGAAGAVDADGWVRSAPGLAARLEAAAAVHLERVLLPATSRGAAEAARERDPALRRLETLYVAHVDEVPERLSGNFDTFGRNQTGPHLVVPCREARPSVLPWRAGQGEDST
jgi:hypothetical protein